MLREEIQEMLLAAFLAGVKAGVKERAVPFAQRSGKRLITGRAQTGRSGFGSGAKTVRKVSAYQKAYGKNFKRIAAGNKLKNGSWKKDGFKRTQKAAHRATKMEMKK